MIDISDTNDIITIELPDDAVQYLVLPVVIDPDSDVGWIDLICTDDE